MAPENTVLIRDIPEHVDVYVIGDDGSITEGAKLTPNIYIDWHDAGQLYDKDIALYIKRTYGHIVGVMRDKPVVVKSRGYKTRKMILGRITPPKN